MVKANSGSEWRIVDFRKICIFVAEIFICMVKEVDFNDDFVERFFELLMHPWVEQSVIQDSIPTFPTTNHEEEIYLDYIKCLFYRYRLATPFTGAIWYLSLDRVHFLKYILEHDIATDYFKNSTRLSCHELYMVFSGISLENSVFLLSQIDCPVSIFSELKNALEDESEDRFASAIDKCDISSIFPVLQYIKYIKETALKMYEGKYSPLREEKEEDNLVIQKKALYGFETFMTEKLGWQPNDKITRLMSFVAKKTLEWEVLPEAYFDFIYSYHYYVYCYLKEDGAFTESETHAFDYLFNQPAFEELYNENLQWWKDGVLDDKLEEFAKELGVEENDDEEVTNPSPRSGEKQRWRLQKYLSRPVQPSKEGHLHCQGIKESIVKKGDYALTKFIQGIADRGYIDDDPITKNSFAYALTGRGGFKTKIITVPWHHNKVKKGISESVKVLLYISKHMFDNTTGDTYTQLFKVLNAGINPCIKDGMDQSPSYADLVSDDFKDFFKSCFEKKSK